MRRWISWIEDMETRLGYTLQWGHRYEAVDMAPPKTRAQAGLTPTISSVPLNTTNNTSFRRLSNMMVPMRPAQRISSNPWCLAHHLDARKLLRLDYHRCSTLCWKNRNSQVLEGIAFRTNLARVY